MHRSSLRGRVAPLTVVALALGMPAAAVAETAPSPSPTTSATSSPSSPSPSSTQANTPTPEPTATQTEGTASGSPAATPTSTPEPTGSSAAPAPSQNTAPPAPSGADAPFTGRQSGARLAGSSSAQAGYAGGYLVRTLAAQGNHYTWPGTDYLDGGNTIDAILGLAGAQVGRDGAAAALAHLEDNVDTYVGGGGETYAGPLGKLIIGVDAAGADATDFGGQDLVARLQELATESGRFSDASQYGDYSNTIGQALDLIALGRTTGDAPQAAIDFLLDQQCADGGFRGTLATAGGACASDLDATAFAAQALVGFGEDEAATRALEYLASKQQASGGFFNGDGAVNANSTAVAAQAFAAAGWSEELAAARGFLADLQLDCSFPASIRGGIAFTMEDRATLLKTPTDQEAIDKMLRATPQSTLALAGGSLLDVTAEGSTATAPAAECSASPSPTASTTPTAPASTSPTAPSGGPTSEVPSTDGPAAAPAGDTSEAAGPGLAYTGASPLGPLTIAVLLLLAGAAAVLASRHRGARQ